MPGKGEGMEVSHCAAIDSPPAGALMEHYISPYFMGAAGFVFSGANSRD
jgi:hypothetical protein